MEALRALNRLNPFVLNNGDETASGLLTIALTASKFNKRPSELLGILDAAVAFDFDTAAAWCLEVRAEKKELERMELLANNPAPLMVELLREK